LESHIWYHCVVLAELPLCMYKKREWLHSESGCMNRSKSRLVSWALAEYSIFYSRAGLDNIHLSLHCWGSL
jgi:hypothetical protein